MIVGLFSSQNRGIEAVSYGFEPFAESESQNMRITSGVFHVFEQTRHPDDP
jgi:hypothetical protein